MENRWIHSWRRTSLQFFRRIEAAKLGKADFQATAETGKIMVWSASGHAVNINLFGFSSAGTLITLSVVPCGRDGLISLLVWRSPHNIVLLYVGMLSLITTTKNFKKLFKSRDGRSKSHTQRERRTFRLEQRDVWDSSRPYVILCCVCHCHWKPAVSVCPWVSGQYTTTARGRGQKPVTIITYHGPRWSFINTLDPLWGQKPSCGLWMDTDGCVHPTARQCRCAGSQSGPTVLTASP